MLDTGETSMYVEVSVLNSIAMLEYSSRLFIHGMDLSESEVL